jgi:hypothetical protein
MIGRVDSIMDFLKTWRLGFAGSTVLVSGMSGPARLSAGSVTIRPLQHPGAIRHEG